MGYYQVMSNVRMNRIIQTDLVQASCAVVPEAEPELHFSIVHDAALSPLTFDGSCQTSGLTTELPSRW